MEANELIPNKWYLEDIGTNKYCYFKFEKIENDVLYFFDAYIDGNNNYVKLMDGTNIPNYPLSNIKREVHIDEIINYLPHDHPDFFEYRRQKISSLLKL